MRPVHVMLRFGCVGLLLASMSVPGAGLDKIGQTGVPATRLGQRIAAHSSLPETSQGMTRYWSAVVIAIAASNPADDAQADAQSGHAGFMTYANDTVAERYIASGMRCLDRSEPRRRTVFHFGYQAPISQDAGKALIAFDAYARVYNAHALATGVLKETSCIDVKN